MGVLIVLQSFHLCKCGDFCSGSLAPARVGFDGSAEEAWCDGSMGQFTGCDMLLRGLSAVEVHCCLLAGLLAERAKKSFALFVSIFVPVLCLPVSVARLCLSALSPSRAGPWHNLRVFESITESNDVLESLDSQSWRGD